MPDDPLDVPNQNLSTVANLSYKQMNLLKSLGLVGGWFIPVAPSWNIGHPRNALFHFSFLICDIQ
jgi:hypothetical protein